MFTFSERPRRSQKRRLAQIPNDWLIIKLLRKMTYTYCYAVRFSSLANCLALLAVN
jgi:hypothetical protein